MTEENDTMRNRLAQLIERVGLMHYGKSLRSKERALLAWVMDFTQDLSEEIDLGERVYICLHGREESHCAHGNHKKFNTLRKGYRFCAHDCQCRKDEQSRKMTEHHAIIGDEEHDRRVKAQQQTMLERHGVENPMHVPAFKTKMEETNLERYGFRYPAESPEIMEKIRATVLAKFGCHHCSTEPVKAKIRSTNLERYGSEHTMDRARAAFTQQFGVPHPFHLPEFQDKAKETMVAKYGSPHALCVPTILDKMMVDLVRKYGVTTVLMLPELQGQPSKIGTAWLDSLNVPVREHYINLGTTSTRADGFDPTTNTVYSFHGDFWHGNPETHDPEAINPRTMTPFGLLYESTMIRDELIRQFGYNLMVMWESEWTPEYRKIKRQV